MVIDTLFGKQLSVAVALPIQFATNKDRSCPQVIFRSAGTIIVGGVLSVIVYVLISEADSFPHASIAEKIYVCVIVRIIALHVSSVFNKAKFTIGSALQSSVAVAVIAQASGSGEALQSTVTSAGAVSVGASVSVVIN